MQFLTPTMSMQLLCLAFLSILFLQSGLDKVVAYKGNLEWLTSHFSKSPLKSMVGVMMLVITILEMVSGLVCAVGLVFILADGSTQWGLIGAQLSSLSIIALFFGQRLAKDYEGAATLTTYFVITLIGIYLMG